MRLPTWTEAGPAAAALAAGLIFGLSAFTGGYHLLETWGLLALGFLAVLLGLAIGRPTVPHGPALAAFAGLVALGVWALISIGWAGSADRAWEEGARWLLYAAVVGTLLLLLATGRDDDPRWDPRVALLAGVAAPLVALAAYLLARMLFEDADSLFFGNRLSEPLGYVNGEAGFLLVGFWCAIAAAERASFRIAQGLAASVAVALAGLAVMAQSRGALFGFAVSAAVLLAIVPGRVRRAWLLVLVGLAVAACAGSLDAVVGTLPEGAGAPPADEVREAALAVLGASAAAGLVWALAGVLGEAAGARLGAARAERLSTAAIATVAAVAVLAAVVIPAGDRVDDVRDQYDAFTELRPVEDGARLGSGGGNRYDYWRVAINQFERHPLRGEGAGNYAADYFRERRTDENLRQAHSIELQTLGEMGLVGFLALCAFAGGGAWGLWRTARADGPYSQALAVAAGGAFVAWLAQTSVDWLHLIPGLAGAALCGLAILLAPSMRRLDPGPGRAVWGARLGVAAAVVLAATAIAIPTLAARITADASDELGSDPARAAELAREATSLNGEAVAPRYVEAAALARLGSYEGARAALQAALEREPDNFVTWALLGDLASRRGELAAAQRAYARASELNPRDARLRELAGSRAAIERQVAASAGG